MMEVDEETRNQFSRIDDQFRRVIDVVIERTSATDVRIDDLRGDLREFHDRVQSNFDALYKRDENRHMEYQAIKAALSRVEVSMNDLQSSVSRLDLADLDARVAQLEAALRGNHDA